MEKLIEMGINKEEIKSMLELNPSVFEESDLDILIDILLLINCDMNIIKNIIITNPLYLSRNKEDIVNLINRFLEMGLRNLNILFDSNPYLLNLDVFDIDDFINEHHYSNEEAINIIESDPFIFDEI